MLVEASFRKLDVEDEIVVELPNGQRFDAVVARQHVAGTIGIEIGGQYVAVGEGDWTFYRRRQLPDWEGAVVSWEYGGLTSAAIRRAGRWHTTMGSIYSPDGMRELIGDGGWQVLRPVGGADE